MLTVALTGRPSLLDDHLAYLHQRWHEGVTSATALHKELQERGFRGSYGTVRDYVKDLRDPATPPARTATRTSPLKARTVAGWILRRPETLEPDEKDGLEQACQRCPHLNALADRVGEFAAMLTGLHGERLDGWLTLVETDPDQPDLHSFAAGIRRDYAAVRAGLTTPHNSGAVEGNVNRIKMTKRQMYGRAGFELLRLRPVNRTGSVPSRRVGQIHFRLTDSSRTGGSGVRSDSGDGSSGADGAPNQCGVDVHRVAAGSAQRLVLGGGVLVAGGDLPIADLHARDCNANVRQRCIGADKGSGTDLSWGDA